MTIEVRESFAEVSNPGSREQPRSEIGPSMLTTFLETCMKLVWDSRALKGLQELMNICAGSSELRVIRKLGKQVMHASSEIQLTTRIGDYEME